jgi:hypothetical protein
MEMFGTWHFFMHWPKEVDDCFKGYNSRVKTGCLGIRIMCPSGATWLSADCCFSELALWNPAQHVGLEQSGTHHDLIES